MVRPGSPHLLPIPVPGIPAERRSARRPEGEARSGPLPCSDLTASSPQTAGPRGPFCMDSGLQGRLGPGSLAPLLTSTQPTGISVAPGNGLVLVSERQSRKGLRRGRRGPRGFCHQSLRRKPTLLLLVDQRQPWVFHLQSYSFFRRKDLWNQSPPLLDNEDRTCRQRPPDPTGVCACAPGARRLQAPRAAHREVRVRQTQACPHRGLCPGLQGPKPPTISPVSPARTCCAPAPGPTAGQQAKDSPTHPQGSDESR